MSKKVIYKTRQKNYYGLGEGYALCMEEDFLTRHFYAWITKQNKPQTLLIFAVEMTYTFNKEQGQYGDEYLELVEVAEQLTEDYIKKYKETYENVQLPEDKKR